MQTHTDTHTVQIIDSSCLCQHPFPFSVYPHLIHTLCTVLHSGHTKAIWIKSIRHVWRVKLSLSVSLLRWKAPLHLASEQHELLESATVCKLDDYLTSEKNPKTVISVCFIMRFITCFCIYSRLSMLAEVNKHLRMFSADGKMLYHLNQPVKDTSAARTIYDPKIIEAAMLVHCCRQVLSLDNHKTSTDLEVSLFVTKSITQPVKRCLLRLWMNVLKTENITLMMSQGRLGLVMEIYNIKYEL